MLLPNFLLYDINNMLRILQIFLLNKYLQSYFKHLIDIPYDFDGVCSITPDIQFCEYLLKIFTVWTDLGKYFWMYAANIIQIFHMTLMISFPREIILQMFVGNCLQLWTWQPGMMHDAHTGMHVDALETNFTLFCAFLWIKTLR